VIRVAVGEDHGRDRLVAQMLPREGQSVPRRGLGGERVHDDPALLTIDQRHVRQVEAAQLMDARGDLVEPGAVVELGLAPEARVHGVGRLAVEEAELGEPSCWVRTVRIQDLLGVRRGDQPALRVFEGLAIREVQRLCRMAVALGRQGRGIGPRGLDRRLLAAGQDR
jgi:hypothetical protein